MSFNEDKSHSLLIDAKIGFQTRDVVNPGAGNNPTAPDEKEDKSGATPLFAHFLYQIKEQATCWKDFIWNDYICTGPWKPLLK